MDSEREKYKTAPVTSFDEDDKSRTVDPVEVAYWKINEGLVVELDEWGDAKGDYLPPKGKAILQRLYDQGRRDGWSGAADMVLVQAAPFHEVGKQILNMIKYERDRRYGKGEE